MFYWNSERGPSFEADGQHAMNMWALQDVLQAVIRRLDNAEQAGTCCPALVPTLCVPIVEIQGKQVGNGKPGNVFKAVDTLLCTDMNANVETDPIPYS